MMSKRKHLPGRFTRNKPLTRGEEEFRVVRIQNKTQEITLIGIFSSLDTARHVANSYKKEGNTMHIHGNSNRVLETV